MISMISYLLVHGGEEKKNKRTYLAYQCTPVIPATQEAEAGGLQFNGSLGKVSKTLSHKQKARRLTACLNGRTLTKPT
jgi:hypothetical protein